MAKEKPSERQSSNQACEATRQGMVCDAQGVPQGQRCAPKTGARGRFFITPHAIERYRNRVHRGINYERALEEIIEMSERAHYVKDYHGNVQYWRGPKPMRLRLLVAPSNGTELPQVMTILPASDCIDSQVRKT